MCVMLHKMLMMMLVVVALAPVSAYAHLTAEQEGAWEDLQDVLSSQAEIISQILGIVAWDGSSFSYQDYLEGALLHHPPSFADSGDFLVVYEQTDNIYFEKLRERYSKHGFFEADTNHLNGSFALPHDIPITLKECGEPTAFYSPNERAIVLCYEHIVEIEDIIFERYEPEAHPLNHTEGGTYSDVVWYDAVSFSDSVITWTLYHEVGHALIDIYDLPVVGMEENAADQIATILVNDHYGNMMNNNVVTYWYELAPDNYHHHAYAGVHALDDQRAYNVACWVYGSDTTDPFELLNFLPEYRAEWCEDEYSKAERSWNALLSPYAPESEQGLESELNTCLPSETSIEGSCVEFETFMPLPRSTDPVFPEVRPEGVLAGVSEYKPSYGLGDHVGFLTYIEPVPQEVLVTDLVGNPAPIFDFVNFYIIYDGALHPIWVFSFKCIIYDGISDGYDPYCVEYEESYDPHYMSTTVLENGTVKVSGIFEIPENAIAGDYQVQISRNYDYEVINSAHFSFTIG